VSDPARVSDPGGASNKAKAGDAAGVDAPRTVENALSTAAARRLAANEGQRRDRRGRDNRDG
jgi:hypothetical protein